MYTVYSTTQAQSVFKLQLQTTLQTQILKCSFPEEPLYHGTLELKVGSRETSPIASPKLIHCDLLLNNKLFKCFCAKLRVSDVIHEPCI